MNNKTSPANQSYQYIEITDISELPVGERLQVDIDDVSVIIFNVDHQFYAIGNTCTHDDGPLGQGELDGFDLICPRHGAKFDIKTGKVLSFPAAKDIPSYPIRIVNNIIEIGLPD